MKGILGRVVRESKENELRINRESQEEVGQGK